MNAPDWHREAPPDEVSSLRVPPHSAMAEQSVLGSLLLENRAWDRVGDVLTEAAFYRHENRLVFGVIGALINASRPADVVTVFERLQAIGKAEEAGGLAYLSALANCVPGSGNARRYAEIVADKALRRQLIAACDAASTATFGEEDTAKVLDRISTSFAQLERGQQRRGPKMLADLMPSRVDRINALQQGEAKAGIATGIPHLDRMLSGGLRDGGVYVLAARPSVGKSSLAQSIGLAVAENDGPVLMLSQEMPDTEVADRAISNLGGVDFGSLQTGRLQGSEWERLTSAVDRAALLPFFVDDQPALRLMDMRSKARQVKGLRLLIVDYLQLAVGDGDNRTQEVGAISRGLKALAKELGVPVILLSQLSRKVEERPGKEPMLSDLRDSGEIEQDADVVLFLWPVREFDGGAKLVGLKVDKNRQGRKGRFGLHFDGAVQRWAESTENIDAAATGARRGGDL